MRIFSHDRDAAVIRDIVERGILAEERIAEFHSSECDDGHGDFHGMDDERRSELQRRFYSIINSVLIYGYASAVRLSHYDTIKPRIEVGRPGGEEFSKAYYLLFQHQIELMAMSIEHPREEQIVFTFDQNQESQSKLRAHRLYNSLLGLGGSSAVPYAHRLRGILFSSPRDVIQLQAADILAYESMRYLRDGWPDHPENERWQYKLLTKTKRINGRIFDEDQLGDLLEREGW